MERFILRFVQDADHPDGYTVAAENELEFRLLFGLIQRTRRYAQAVTRLRTSGFSVEARVLVRSALEHAVTAQWAYLTPGGIDRLNVSYATSQADLTDAINLTLEKPDLAHAKKVRDSIPRGRALPKFTGPGGIMSDLDSEKFLAISYRVLSQTGHVTYEAALDHFDDSTGELQLKFEPADRVSSEALYALTGFCMLAAWLTARLERDEAEIVKLKGLAQELSVPWRLDEHLPADQRRFLDD